VAAWLVQEGALCGLDAGGDAGGHVDAALVRAATTPGKRGRDARAALVDHCQRQVAWHAAFVAGLVLGACRRARKTSARADSACAAAAAAGGIVSGPKAGVGGAPPSALGRLGDAALLSRVASFAGAPMGRPLRNLNEFLALVGPPRRGT
jgi:hypothetical protein